MMPDFPLLASAELSTLGVPSWLWPAMLAALGLLAVSFLLTIATNVAKCWEIFRVKPPAHETYATKGELEAMEKRLTAEIGTNRENTDNQVGVIFGKIDSMQKAFQTFTNDIFRAVGRIEGAQKDE